MQSFIILVACGVLATGAAKGLTPTCKGSGCPQPPSNTEGSQPFRPSSCLDYLRRGEDSCGVYKIYDSAGQSFPAYCDMKSEPGNAWTLVMSWSQTNKLLDAFRKTPFKDDAPVNANAPNWKLHRQTLSRMQSLKGHSSHWRATCSFPTKGVDYTDYVRGSFKDFDILNYIGSGQCKKVELINIRGHLAIERTARFWAVANAYTLHVDSSASGCQFVPRSGSVPSEDNFGYYHTVNSKFRCSEGPQATTQWWFGGHL